MEFTADKMTLEDKARLVNGATFFGTAGFPEYGIPKMQVLDGGTGLNFEQLFGEFVSRQRLETEEGLKESLSSSKSLQNVIAHFYEPELIEEKDKELYEWISDRLKDLNGTCPPPACFPAGILMGATWNPEVVYEMGSALGMEAKAYGVSMLLGTPYVNIMRDPLNGRLFEGYSEDPYLVSQLAPAMVKGVQSRGVAANVKHFAANNQESFRVGVDETVSRRALEEIYFPGFKACVDAGVATVMSAYNGINGVPCTENKWLLQDVLREEWGFDGMVVSDWGAVYHPVQAIMAGNDLAMPGPIDGTPIVEAVKNGTLSMEELDTCVNRILKLVKQYCAEAQDTLLSDTELDMTVSDRAAYQAVLEGAVLLKNESMALPIAGSVTIMGDGGGRFFDCGTGSAGITTSRTGSLYEELNQKANASVNYYSSEEVEKLDGEVTLGDTILVVVRQLGMEGNDRKNLYLPESERQLLKRAIAIGKEHNKKIGVVLNVCGPIDCSEFIEDVDAVICVFLPGMKGAEALADLLIGRVSPSGKLPVTFPKRYEDTPTFINFPGDGKHVIYGEDIFVGYRYYDTKKIEVAFPFGYGLSYTEFAYSNMQVSEQVWTDRVKVSVDVTNIKDVAGKEVVALYVRDLHATIRKPDKELKGFQKVYLEPGQTKTVEFVVTKDMVASFDADLNRWEAEEGYYDLLICASAEDVRCSQRVYGDWKSAYSYSQDTPIKVLYEKEELQAMVKQLFADEGLDIGYLYSNYEYTPHKTLAQVMAEAGLDVVPVAFLERLATVKKD